MNSPRILVIRGGAIGDFILTLPAIELLRKQSPEGHLEILGYPAIAKLALDAGMVDKVRSIEYSALAGFFNPGGILDPDLMDYFASFSLIVSYLYDPDGFFHGNLSKSGEGTVLACSHRVAEDGDHAARQLAQPLEQLALFLDDPAPRLAFPDSLPQASGETAPIAIHPGSGSPRKNWPTDRWVEAAERLHKAFPHRPFLIVSGEADEESAPPLLAELERRRLPHRHAAGLDLSKLGAELSGCALFLGHDSGVSHLAAATGIPCLLLFGPTDPAIWAPQNPRVRVVASADGKLNTISPQDVADGAAGQLSHDENA